MTTTFMEKLFSRKREDRARQAETWAQFVSQCEAETVSVDDAAAMLDSFGKTEKELASAIETRRKLIASRAIIAQETDWQSEIDLIGTAIEKENREANEAVQAIHKKHAETVAELRGRSNELQRKLFLVGDARAFVMEHSRLPDTVADQLAAYSRESAALLQERERLVALKSSANVTGTLTKARRAELETNLQHVEQQMKAVAAKSYVLEWNALA